MRDEEEFRLFYETNREEDVQLWMMAWKEDGIFHRFTYPKTLRYWRCASIFPWLGFSKGLRGWLDE